MPISFVAAGAVSTGANPTVAVPAGYTTNDLLLLITSGTAAPTIPSGWTQVSAEGANRFITVLYKFASSSESSVSLTLAGTTSVAVMLAYRGAGAYEIVPAYTTGTSTTATPNTLTTTVANDYVINVYANLSGAARTLTANASTTSRANSSTTTTVNGLLIADELRASTGVTTARAATISASSAWSSIAIGFMPARNVYWVGATGTWDTTSTTNWSLTSGGTAGTPVPTIIDDVLIDANSASSNGNLLGITLTGALTCKSITVSGAACNFFDGTSPTLTCAGGITLTNTSSWPSTGTITLTGTGTITTKGVRFSAPIVINGSGITVTLGDSLWTTGSITVTQGTFDTASKPVTCTTFSSSNTNTRAITLGTSTVTLTSTANPATIWDLGTTTNLTFSGASSAIRIPGRSTAVQTFAGGGLTYGKVMLTTQNLFNNSYTFIISGANTFASLSTNRATFGGSSVTTITFPAGVTTTFGLFLVQAGNITINSSSAGSAATLTYTGPGKCSLGTNVASVRDINFSAANTFYVGAGATNAGNNTNVNFSTYILYWVGGNGTWDASSTARWATSSGGAGGADVPSANTPVIVNGSSGSPTITLSGSPTCASLDTTGATCTFTSTGTLSIYGNLTLTSTTTWSGSGKLTIKDNCFFNIGGTSSRLSGCLLQCPLEIDTQGGSVFTAAGGGNVITTVQNTITLTSGLLGRDPTTGFSVFFECTTFLSNNSNYRELNVCTVIPTSNNATIVTMTNSSGFISNSGVLRPFYTGSTGTRTIDLGTDQQTSNLEIQITGGTDTIAFTSGSIIGVLNTAAQGAPYNTAFTGTFSHGNYIYGGSVSIGSAVTISGASAFNLYNLTGQSGAQTTWGIDKTLSNDVNLYGYRVTFSFRISTVSLNTTGTLSFFSAPMGGGANSSAQIYVGILGSGTITTRKFIQYSGEVRIGTNFFITGNNDTVLDLRLRAVSQENNTTGYYTLNYSGSTGTRTLSVLNLSGGSGAFNSFTNAFVKVNAGTDTVNIVDGSVFNALDFTGFSGTLTGSGTLYAGGQNPAIITFSSGMTQSNTANWGLNIQSRPVTITSNGKSFLGNVTGGAALVTLADNFVTTGTLTVGNSLTTSSNVTANAVAINGTTTMGSGTWTLTGTGTVWNMANVTLNSNTSTIVLSDTSATARTFAGGGKTYYNLVIGGTTGSSTTTITGANTFNQISSTKTVAHTLSFAADQTVTTWALSGTAGNLATINSNTANTARTITVTNRTSGVDYLIVRDITSNKTPVTFFAGANSQLQSNVAGVAARAALPTTEFLYVLDTGTSWTVPANFNSSNNSIHLISGGGGGAGGRASGGTRAGGGGGGGGGYTRATNVALTPGASISYAVGAAGALGAGGANGGDGGATTFNSGTYTTTGGGGGQATTTSSTGGTAGTGSTFNGGVGGVGSFNASSHGHGGGGGGGAAGLNGAGQNGGNGFANATAANVAGGGGGGNGGGTAGGNASSATGGTGGNNFGGSGGASSTAVTAFNGGGGAGGVNATAPGLGSCGVDIYGVGGAGGRGGSPQGAAGTIGLHNYGGGGAGGGVSTTGTTQSGGTGGQGSIIIWYSTITPANGNFFFLFG